MNKAQLIDALAARIGDRRTASTALDGLLETIVDTVGTGEQVSITGFGVFESRARAARVARNPRTGEAVQVAATTVPAFRPGAGFRTKVGGAEPAPRVTPAPAPRATPARGSRTTTGDAPVRRPARSTAAASPAVASVPEVPKAGGAPKSSRSSGAKAATAAPGTKAATAAPEAKVAAPAKVATKGKSSKVGVGDKAKKVKSKK